MYLQPVNDPVIFALLHLRQSLLPLSSSLLIMEASFLYPRNNYLQLHCFRFLRIRCICINCCHCYLLVSAASPQATSKWILRHYWLLCMSCICINCCFLCIWFGGLTNFCGWAASAWTAFLYQLAAWIAAILPPGNGFSGLMHLRIRFCGCFWRSNASANSSLRLLDPLQLRRRKQPIPPWRAPMNVKKLAMVPHPLQLHCHAVEDVRKHFRILNPTTSKNVKIILLIWKWRICWIPNRLKRNPKSVVLLRKPLKRIARRLRIQMMTQILNIYSTLEVEVKTRIWQWCCHDRRVGSRIWRSVLRIG